jgi:hypothetical protein
MKLLRTEKTRPGVSLAFPHFDDSRKTLQLSILEGRVAMFTVRSMAGHTFEVLEACDPRPYRLRLGSQGTPERR